MTTNYLIARVDSSHIGDYTARQPAFRNSVSSHLVGFMFETYGGASNARIVQLDSTHVGHLPALTENNSNGSLLVINYLAPLYTTWAVTQALPVYEFELRVVITNAGTTSSGTKFFWYGGSNGLLSFKWSTSGTVRTFKIQDVGIPALADGDWVKVRLVATSASGNNKCTFDVYVNGERILTGFAPSVGYSVRNCGINTFSLSNVSKWSDDPSRVEIANFKVYEQDEYTAPPTVTFSQDQTVGSSLITANVTLDPGIEDHAVSYLWSTGETTQSIRVYANGEYTVTVTDSAGGVTTKTFTLSDLFCLPAPLQASYSFSSEPAIVRTSMYDGRARQRIMSGGEKHKSLNCQFLMDEDSLDLWQQNWRETLKEGSEWFWLRTLGNDDFVEYHNVRLKKGEWKAKLAYSSDSETVYTVSMDLEVR